jgi:uridine phosphorylase
LLEVERPHPAGVVSILTRKKDPYPAWEMLMTKKFHMDAADLLKMVQLEPGSLGKYAIVPGPIDRIEPIHKQLTDPVKEFSFAGFDVYTGEVGGVLVTAANSGMYAPPAAIIAEILAEGGTEYMIRVGSCGAMRADIHIGDLIIVTGCIRGEGTTRYYVPDSFSTVADISVTRALIEACERLGQPYHVGTIWTTDALLRESKAMIDEMIGLKAIGVDMISSSLLTVAQLKGVKAGGILAVSDNLITGELGFVSPKYYEAETRTVGVALEAVNILESWK